MPPYVAGSHPWADKFVPRHLSDGLGQFPFVYGDPLANQFDGSFLIGFVCKTPELSRLSRPERQQFLSALDDGAFTPARSNFVRIKGTASAPADDLAILALWLCRRRLG